MRAGFASRWGPVVGAWALAVVCIVVLTNRYDVSGHAIDHLYMAGWMGFIGAAVVFTIAWTTPQMLRQPEVVVVLVAWFATAVLIQVANLRVVQDYIDAGIPDVPEESATVADHGLANAVPGWALVTALGFVLTVWRRKLVSKRAAIAALVLNFLVLPWFFPGFGVVVVMLARLRADSRKAEVVPGE